MMVSVSISSQDHSCSSGAPQSAVARPNWPTSMEIGQSEGVAAAAEAVAAPTLTAAAAGSTGLPYGAASTCSVAQQQLYVQQYARSNRMQLLALRVSSGTRPFSVAGPMHGSPVVLQQGVGGVQQLLQLLQHGAGSVLEASTPTVPLPGVGAAYLRVVPSDQRRVPAVFDARNVGWSRMQQRMQPQLRASWQLRASFGLVAKPVWGWQHIITPASSPRMACEGSLLLALPDLCLLLVLQCCVADDHRSLFNAARAHSRLRQAAVVALRSITARVSHQQQMDSMMVYLGKHGQHVDSLQLTGGAQRQFSLGQLPQQLQLSSLQLSNLCLQLQPGGSSQGVLGAAASPALKQLCLTGCTLLDDGAAAALAAALSQLSARLEHLSIDGLYDHERRYVQLPAGVLQQLQHLTHLELSYAEIVGLDVASPALQPPQALNALVSLKLNAVLSFFWREGVIASLLSGMQQLTRLELPFGMGLEAGALAGKTQMQHLSVSNCEIMGGAAGVAQLLCHLQPMQQLTHLTLQATLRAGEEGNPPASAYAALTASSKLQHLDISHCTLPAGAWQHLFSTDRQVPNLQSLAIAGVLQPSGEYAQPPESSRLVSCCPRLRSLYLGPMQCSVQLLAALQGLSGLQTLHCDWEGATAPVATIVQAVCQLTGLRELDMEDSARMREAGLVMQLTQLKQLTSLHL